MAIYKPLVILLLVSIFACGEDDVSSQIINKRDNIIGEWKINLISEEIRSDTVYNESSDLRDISFNADGTGIRQTLFTDSEMIEWYYQTDPEKVIIVTESEFNPAISFTQVHTVIENTEDNQVWQYEVVPTSGSADKYINTWKMRRN